MSIFVELSPGNRFEVPLDTEQIQNKIDEYIKKNNLVLRQIIHAGLSYLKISDVKKKLSNGSTIYLSVYPIITDATTLIKKMMDDNGGWKEISKCKPVATLSSGQTWWFTENYPKLSFEEKNKFKTLLSDELNQNKDYKIELDIYVPTIKENHQIFFYVLEFFRIACEVVDCTVEEGYEFVSDWTYNESILNKKKLLINLVFGDFYKTNDPISKLELSTNSEFIRVLNEYNRRVGLQESKPESESKPEPKPEPKPESKLELKAKLEEKTNGDDLIYKAKYIKYKAKYIKLKNYL